MRDAKGRFTKGPDETRHVFTKEECVAGYNSLVERVGGSCGIAVAKKRAYWVMCGTEAVRYDNPALRAVEPVKFKTPAEYKAEYKEKYGKDHSVGPVTVENSLDEVAAESTEPVYDWLAGEPFNEPIPVKHTDPFSTRYLEALHNENSPS